MLISPSPELRSTLSRLVSEICKGAGDLESRVRAFLEFSDLPCLFFLSLWGLLAGGTGGLEVSGGLVLLLPVLGEGEVTLALRQGDTHGDLPDLCNELQPDLSPESRRLLGGGVGSAARTGLE